MPSRFAEDLVALLPRLRRFALSLTGSVAEADDLVQAACERALRARDLWEPGTRLDSWVYRIIRNLWIDTVRRRKTEGHVEAIDEVANVEGEDGRQVTETALTLTDVNNAVSELPQEQRAVLLLVCTEERSYKEAADMLGIPVGTVMSRLARGRRSLAQRFNIDDAVYSSRAQVTTP